MLPNPIRAQGKPNKLPIAPCLPADVTLIKLSGTETFAGDWAQVIRNHDAIYALEGEVITWLGYAKQGHESDEWYGVKAGFAGVNMYHYGEQTLLSLYNKDKELVGRIEVHEYPITHTYILFFTTTYQFTDSVGRHMGFHIYAYPNTYNQTSCMFFVDEVEFEQALGWRK